MPSIDAQAIVSEDAITWPKEAVFPFQGFLLGAIDVVGGGVVITSLTDFNESPPLASGNLNAISPGGIVTNSIHLTFAPSCFAQFGLKYVIGGSRQFDGVSQMRAVVVDFTNNLEVLDLPAAVTSGEVNAVAVLGNRIVLLGWRQFGNYRYPVGRDVVLAGDIVFANDIDSGFSRAVTLGGKIFGLIQRVNGGSYFAKNTTLVSFTLQPDALSTASEKRLNFGENFAVTDMAAGSSSVVVVGVDNGKATVVVLSENLVELRRFLLSAKIVPTVAAVFDGKILLAGETADGALLTIRDLNGVTIDTVSLSTPQGACCGKTYVSGIQVLSGHPLVLGWIKSGSPLTVPSSAWMANVIGVNL